MRRYLISMALVAVLLPTVASTQDMTSDDTEAIEKLWESYSAAQLDGDPEAWLALWDEDGVQMPPGTPARGVKVLREVMPERMASQKVSSFDIDPEDIVVSGDWAWARGTYSVDGEAGAEAFHVDGKFLTILKRQPDGSWGIYRDAFNSNSK